jgi:HEAT repeat protein
MGPETRRIARPLVPFVAELLTDPNLEIRLAACGALGEMGPDARAAIPALTKAADDPELKGFVHHALKKVDSGNSMIGTQ